MKLPCVETRVPELLRLRRVASNAFVAVLWTLLALNAGVAYASGMVAGGVALFGAVVGTAATRRDLADQTEQLERLVGFFRLQWRDAAALGRAA